MPAVDIVAFAAHTRKFLKHWADSEEALGTPILLNNGETRADLTALLTDLETTEAELLTAQNTRQEEQKDRNTTRASVHRVGKKARITLQKLAAKAGATGGLPARMPSLNAEPGDVLQALRDIAEVWKRVNQLAPPEVPATPLPLIVSVEKEDKTVESVSLVEYNGRIQTFARSVTGLSEANTDEARLRGQRDKLIERVRPLLKDYRGVAAMRLPAGHALLKTIPAL